MSSLPQPPSLMQVISVATRDVPKGPPTARQDCSDVVHITLDRVSFISAVGT